MTSGSGAAATTAAVWGVQGAVVVRGGRTVLDRVDLEVPAGRVTAVVGGDGAGKTTLTRLLAGLELPDAGRVMTPGVGRVGAMPATSGVWGDLSVAENVDLVARAYGADPARGTELLDAAGLGEVQGRLGRQLSGGMRQKLGFCLALLHRPELAVLDEPSTGVDPVSRIELWRMISRAAGEGTAVLLTTTYLDEAERADQVLVLDQGTVIHRGDPDGAAARVRGTLLVEAGDRAGGVGLALPGADQDGASPDTAGVPRVGAGDAPDGAAGPVRAVVVGVLPPQMRGWRRGRNRHGLLPADAPLPSVARPGPRVDLEDAVIALTLEHRAEQGDETGGSPVPAAPTNAGGQGAAVPSRPEPSRAGAAPVVVADRVTTAFGTHRAVDDVSLSVAPGQVVGLLGANGAGKTTLIRTVLGLLAPSAGRVAVLGGAPSRGARRRLGYVPQGLGLARDLTVVENLDFVADAYGCRRPALPADLAENGDRLVGALGLGLQRRVAFLAALLHDPELLVLDEPTSGVDPLARADLWDLVRRQAEQGVGVLVTTHYMQEAEQCDALVLMARGRVVAAGTRDDLLRGVEVVQVETDDWSQAFAVLTAAGHAVTVAGREVRVVGAAPDRVTADLAAGGVPARAHPVPARLDEVVLLAHRGR